MSSSHSVAPPRAERFGGLDGLRAVAVALVLAYHLFPGLLPGGFLGVDVFFAISGFLITSLLIREFELRGGIGLGRFWRRRARRLLPALGLVLLVSAALAAVLGGDLLVGIGAQLLGSALFASNWVFIANGADYFARDTPELLRNTWSLAIEEQFYLALPLLLLLLVRLRRRAARALPLLALGLGSAVLMAALSVAGADPTRVYFGSDTHTFGLLLGAALAAALPRPDAARPLGARGQLTTAAAALAGLGTIGWLALWLPEGGDASFRGGFQLAALAALVTIWAVTRPGARLGRALDAGPLRWLGERSYGVYLWHWPLLLICSAATASWGGAPARPWIVGAVTLAVTLAVAAASYRWVEQPVRRLGFRGALRRLGRAIRAGTPRRRLAVAALGALLAVAAGGTVAAVATAPRSSSAAEAIARGQEELERRAAADDRAADDDVADADAAGAGTGPEGLPAEGPDITAVGDSVMLASLPELDAALPGIDVDAAVSRGMGAGVARCAELRDAGALRSVLVVGLGTNGPVAEEDLAALRDVAGSRPIVLVGAHGERDWIPGVNETLARFATAHRGVVLADWSGAVAGAPGALAGDGIHPNPSGGEIYAGAVQRALDELDEPGEALGYALPRR